MRGRNPDRPTIGSLQCGLFAVLAHGQPPSWEQDPVSSLSSPPCQLQKSRSAWHPRDLESTRCRFPKGPWSVATRWFARTPVRITPFPLLWPERIPPSPRDSGSTDHGSADRPRLLLTTESDRAKENQGSGHFANLAGFLRAHQMPKSTQPAIVCYIRGASILNLCSTLTGDGSLEARP